MNTSPVEFLERVLPDEGYYACLVIDAPARRQLFVNSIRELAETVQRIDREGRTVYFGCASYLERGRRTAVNARSAQAFWIDVDTRLTHPEAPYADPYEAAEAVAAFCIRVEFPPPIYVCTGGGLHNWWPLDVPMEPDTWVTYARALKQLCRDKGLVADADRTSDIASVLRLPGTHNRKTGVAVEVVCGPLVGPYPIEAFGRLLNVKENNLRKLGESTDKQRGRPEARRERHQGITGSLAQTFDSSPKFANLVGNDCGQLRNFRATHGCISEPLWFAGIGVLVWCIDGESTIHEWSSGYERYSFEETQGKIERKKQLTGATTCRQFHDLNPQVCEACPHWGHITSPISLGRQEREENNAGGTTADETDTDSETKTAEGPPRNLNGLPNLPHNYDWGDNDELIFRGENVKGGKADVTISSYPIYLDQVQTGEIQDEWNFLLKQYIPERNWFDIHISASDLYGSTGVSKLASRGANILDHGYFIRFVRASVDFYYRTRKMTVQHDQFGWKEDDTAFLYGLDLYRASGIDRVPGNNDLMTRCENEWIGPRPKGTLDGWKSAANKLFTAGCESQSIALLASFGAPLMRFQDRIEGGAIIHFVTPESGTGKSTALVGAGSVWGDPRGLGLASEDTKVSRALTLAAMGNLPVIHDELVLGDPEAIRQFINMFTGGRDKLRGTRNGEIKHTASSWQTIMLSAANTSLVEPLSGLADGPAARVMEFGSEIPQELKGMGDKLRRELLANSGHAGAFYIAWLVQPDNLKFAIEFLHSATDELWKITRAKPEMRFWVRTIASMLVGGWIAKNKLGIINFSADRIREWLMKYLYARIDGRFSSFSSPFGEFLNDHRDCILYVSEWRKGSDAIVKREPPRRLLVRYEDSSNQYMIDLKAFKEWCVKKEISLESIMKKSIKSKLVIKDRQFLTLGRGTDIPGGQTWAIVIDGKHEDMGGELKVGKDNVVTFEPRTRL